MKPLCIDLFCGLGGWADGFLAEGYEVVGFDIERHDYGTGGYPGQLVLQDVLTLSGKQFARAAVIVASPPCTEYSYMAMPWSRSKQIAGALRGEVPFPENYKGSRTIEDLSRLFKACFRIAEEAGVPLVVENVKGAQPWVGSARANFGSFCLWGDVNSVGGAIVGPTARFGELLKPKRGRKPDEPPALNGHDDPRRGRKNTGGSWFAVANNTTSGHKQNPDGRKVPMNFHEHEKTGKPGRSFQSVAVLEGGKGFVTGLGKGHDWRQDPIGRFNSKSLNRKAASAQIAKIPFPLAQHIARVFKP